MASGVGDDAVRERVVSAEAQYHYSSMPWSELPFTYVPCPHQHFKAPNVNRDELSHNDHIALLSTPRGYRWIGEANLEQSPTYTMVRPARRRPRSDRKAIVGTEQKYIHEFLSEVWNMMTPEMVDRLKKLLVDEFGMSSVEAEDFISEQADMAESTKKTGCLVDLDIRSHWLKEFRRLLTCKITDYLVMMLCARRSQRTRMIASEVLKHICDITGERCSLNKPRNRVQRIQVFVADRVAAWLSGVVAESDKEMCSELGGGEGGDGTKKVPQRPEPQKKHKPQLKPKPHSKPRPIKKDKKEAEGEGDKGSKPPSGATSREPSKPASAKGSQPSSKGGSKPTSAKGSKPTSKEPSKPASGEASKEPSKPASAAGSKGPSKPPSGTASKEPSKPASGAASKEPSKPASKEPSKPASKEPSKPASKEPSKPASKEPSKPASKEPSKPASKEPSKPASKEPSKPPSKPGSKSPSKPSSKSPSKPGSKKESGEGSKADVVEEEKAEDVPAEPGEELEGAGEGESPIEEPAAEKPAAEEPATEEPAAEEPAPEEAVGEEVEPEGEPEAIKEEEIGATEGEPAKEGTEVVEEEEPTVPRDPMEVVKEWIEETPKESTPRQSAVSDIIEGFIREEMGDVTPEEDQAIVDVSGQAGTWVDKLVGDAEKQLEGVVVPPPTDLISKKVTFHVKQGDSGCYYDVKRVGSETTCEKTLAARAPRVAVTAANVCKRPADNKSLETPGELKEWAEWAAGVVNVAEQWVSWIDRTCGEAERKAKARQKGDTAWETDWKKFKKDAEARATEWRRNRKYLKETAKIWDEKIASLTKRT